MKKWLVALTTLTFALATAGAVTAFTLTGSEGEDPGDVNPAGGTAHCHPAYEEPLSEGGDGKVVTTIDDIDPNECNAVHNINACTHEQLEELGMGPITGSITVGEPHPMGEPDPGTDVHDKPEPLFVDGEPRHMAPVQLECGTGEGVYVTSKGEVGCTAPPELEDGREGQSHEAQAPESEPLVLPAAE